eukprot:CAMPEP_0197861786 /NCGR_PEP_ID=MMETSP1438-20131217/38060_1 /TAXON_ID=1461541 /ORGANISM="Pterosperma sp., Strain CCMP1384" /LENGTH=179 /DNA_ID=CAMNT_0043479085 /DNA_START=67 /DNA_END=606 /DNA_ORIENTATION=+
MRCFTLFVLLFSFFCLSQAKFTPPTELSEATKEMLRKSGKGHMIPDTPPPPEDFYFDLLPVSRDQIPVHTVRTGDNVYFNWDDGKKHSLGLFINSEAWRNCNGAQQSSNPQIEPIKVGKNVLWVPEYPSTEVYVGSLEHRDCNRQEGYFMKFIVVDRQIAHVRSKRKKDIEQRMAAGEL